MFNLKYCPLHNFGAISSPKRTILVLKLLFYHLLFNCLQSSTAISFQKQKNNLYQNSNPFIRVEAFVLVISSQKKILILCTLFYRSWFPRYRELFHRD
jgi:hypothetical protein